jgi:hypothetical protein
VSVETAVSGKTLCSLAPATGGIPDYRNPTKIYLPIILPLIYQFQAHGPLPGMASDSGQPHATTGADSRKGVRSPSDLPIFNDKILLYIMVPTVLRRKE